MENKELLKKKEELEFNCRVFEELSHQKVNFEELSHQKVNYEEIYNLLGFIDDSKKIKILDLYIKRIKEKIKKLMEW